MTEINSVIDSLIVVLSFKIHKNSDPFINHLLLAVIGSQSIVGIHQMLFHHELKSIRKSQSENRNKF